MAAALDVLRAEGKIPTLFDDFIGKQTLTRREWPTDSRCGRIAVSDCQARHSSIRQSCPCEVTQTSRLQAADFSGNIRRLCRPSSQGGNGGHDGTAGAVAENLGHTSTCTQRVRLPISARLYHLTHSNKLISTFTMVFHQLLHSSLPAIFPAYLHEFLVASLGSLPSHLLDPPHNPHMLQTVPINPQKVPPPTPHLSRLGILPRYSATLSAAAFEEIRKIAQEEAAKGWAARRLTRARQRVGDGVANWLSGMFEGRLDQFEVVQADRG